MHLGSWIFGLLALASLASVVVRRPWTMIVARRHNPPEVWSTDLFRETNMLLTTGWAVLFAGAAILASLAPLSLNIAWGAVLLVLGHFSPRLGSLYASRRLRAMGLSPPEDEPPNRVV